jgi:hypothetical protein
VDLSKENGDFMGLSHGIFMGFTAGILTEHQNYGDIWG